MCTECVIVPRRTDPTQCVHIMYAIAEKCEDIPCDIPTVVLQTQLHPIEFLHDTAGSNNLQNAWAFLNLQRHMQRTLNGSICAYL